MNERRFMELNDIIWPDICPVRQTAVSTLAVKEMSDRFGWSTTQRIIVWTTTNYVYQPCKDHSKFDIN